MDSPSILIRATLDDLPELLVMIREFCDIDGHDFDKQRIRTTLPALLEGDDYGLVWKIGNPTDGYAVVTWGYSLESGGREALIDEIYIRSRNSGTGSLAMSAILDECRDRGCQVVFLETEAHNERVRRFYARSGFVQDDSVWMSQRLAKTPNTT